MGVGCVRAPDRFNFKSHSLPPPLALVSRRGPRQVGRLWRVQRSHSLVGRLLSLGMYYDRGARLLYNDGHMTNSLIRRVLVSVTPRLSLPLFDIISAGACFLHTKNHFLKAFKIYFKFQWVVLGTRAFNCRCRLVPHGEEGTLRPYAHQGF